MRSKRKRLLRLVGTSRAHRGGNDGSARRKSGQFVSNEAKSSVNTYGREELESDRSINGNVSSDAETDESAEEAEGAEI